MAGDLCVASCLIDSFGLDSGGGEGKVSSQSPPFSCPYVYPGYRIQCV